MFLFLYGEVMREREREREATGKVASELPFSGSLGKMMNSNQMIHRLAFIYFDLALTEAHWFG
jgi:hypothetical protein